MNQSQLLADLLERNLHMFNMTLADFSDSDMLVRPCPGANHAAWQIGHLIASETRMVGGVKPGAVPELPAGFEQKFSKETSGNDDAAFFPRKAELLNQLAKTHAAAVAWVKTLAPADLDKASPSPMASFAPTIGHLASLAGAHLIMHMGQLQVIRRKLGKPILF